jgi:hypothetical protein
MGDSSCGSLKERETDEQNNTRRNVILNENDFISIMIGDYKVI